MIDKSNNFFIADHTYQKDFHFKENLNTFYIFS